MRHSREVELYGQRKMSLGAPGDWGLGVPGKAQENRLYIYDKFNYRKSQAFLKYPETLGFR